MGTRAQQIAEQVKALDPQEREDFLAWLGEFEADQMDDWDQEIARDSAPDGRLSRVLDRARKDIAEGRTKPLDQFLDDA